MSETKIRVDYARKRIARLEADLASAEASGDKKARASCLQAIKRWQRIIEELENDSD